MIHNPAKYQTMPVGIVLRRTPGITRWQRFNWSVSAVLPGAAPADWKELRREKFGDGEAIEFHIATLTLELHGADTEAYLHGLHAKAPSVYAVLRYVEDDARPIEPLLITASPYEAQDYTDAGEELVEKVPMPNGLHNWVWEFVEAHHVEEEFIKRKRDKKRIDLKEDGIGDVRIRQTADVYRAPVAARKVRLQ